jgi:hypothetical protein
VVTTFGPGALLDLPNHSVIVAGLDQWGDPVREDAYRPIVEARLQERVSRALDGAKVRMYAPPVDPEREDGRGATAGVRAIVFPEWFVSQLDESTRPDVRSRRLLRRGDLVKGRYFGPDKKKHPVVPVRFLQACVAGHISDLDWHGFAHEYQSPCKRALWLDERGSTGDIAVRCECGHAPRRLSTALTKPGRPSPLGICRGQRPWLGPNAREECRDVDDKPRQNRLLIRHASNAYFPQNLSVIAIPDADLAVRDAVDLVWEDYLLYVESQDELVRDRRKARVAAALEGFTDLQVWGEIQRRRRASSGGGGGARDEKSLKQAELETLLSPRDSIGQDVPDADFYATRAPLAEGRAGALKKVARVVLVHRLREVTAQVGFTRFEAPFTDVDGELALNVVRAALAREMTWVPAVENRGEGVFLALDPEVLESWEAQPKVVRRGDALVAGFNAWLAAHPGSRAKFPGVRYVLLHTLSHMLMTAVALECGYAASSIRERVYATESGSGILLYTGTPDAEGTLGGLVEVGRNVGAHLRAALDYGRLCSNDPICAQHRPDNRQEERFLHGAACHGCLLIAEPACERRNEFLDRALVVETVENLGAELFDESDSA